MVKYYNLGKLQTTENKHVQKSEKSHFLNDFTFVKKTFLMLKKNPNLSFRSTSYLILNNFLYKFVFLFKRKGYTVDPKFGHL